MTLSWKKYTSPLLDFGLGHVTYLDQWNTNGHDMNRGRIEIEVELGFLNSRNTMYITEKQGEISKNKVLVTQ